MVSHEQIMDLLRRNANYNDNMGSTNGAGYIGGYESDYSGGRQVGRPYKSRGGAYIGGAYIGGCCCAGGCQSCMGGYKGIAKDVVKGLRSMKKYKSDIFNYPCTAADKKNAKHYGQQDLYDLMHKLRLEHNDVYVGDNKRKMRTPNQEANTARLAIKRAYCPKSEATPAQLEARYRLSLMSKLFKYQRLNGSDMDRKDFYKLAKKASTKGLETELKKHEKKKR